MRQIFLFHHMTGSASPASEETVPTLTPWKEQRRQPLISGSLTILRWSPTPACWQIEDVLVGRPDLLFLPGHRQLLSFVWRVLAEQLVTHPPSPSVVPVLAAAVAGGLHLSLLDLLGLLLGLPLGHLSLFLSWWSQFLSWWSRWFQSRRSLRFVGRLPAPPRHLGRLPLPPRRPSPPHRLGCRQSPLSPAFAGSSSAPASSLSSTSAPASSLGSLSAPASSLGSLSAPASSLGSLSA
ncbi:uncharacterized protein LOC106517832, partial [Austrofundulus limnaeus]|uniref:Uncharacterized protein LOC106517832 n=1 Tax=Austrofundulus limnaeus TaxID=52670 RepID=A0A2I4B9C0_AUSLI